MDRDRDLERLTTETFDLVVIGAGAVGAAIALEAAQTGATVALIDAGDFGGATSSASSKLIHGGLRYLQMADFALIREAHLERRRLLDRLAPHLVRELTFVLPVLRGGPHSVAAIAGAMATYAALSGFRHSRARMTTPARARRLVPQLRTDGMLAAAVYDDAETHDSRLVLATVTAAVRAGAVAVNHLPAIGLDHSGGRLRGVAVPEGSVRCRMVVNAAGPWVDRVRCLEDPAVAPMARLSKGAHVVVDLPDGWRAAVTTPLEGGRVTFAIPWEGVLLLGTTDTEYEGDPGAVRADPDDVATVLGEARIALPAEVTAAERVRYAFAGLRVLPTGEGDTAAAQREELIRTGAAGMVSVAGGKLTTHRQIADRVLRHLPAFARARPGDRPLPGAGPTGPRPPLLDPDVWAHLTHLYGSEASRVVGLGAERIHPEGPDVWGQVAFAVRDEWARTVDDVLRRRTTVQVRGLDTEEVRTAVAATIADLKVFTGVDGH